MRAHDCPRITKEKDIVVEICARTGLPYNATYQTLKALQDVVKECVESEVEVKFLQLGTFSWKNKPPHEGVVYTDPKTGKPLPPKDVPGFRIPYLRISQSWRKELRALTEFWEKENEKE